jgi:hypothetical protein
LKFQISKHWQSQLDVTIIDPVVVGNSCNSKAGTLLGAFANYRLAAILNMELLA